MRIPKLAAKAVALKKVDGRLMPSARFKLDPGTLRAVTAKASQAEVLIRKLTKGKRDLITQTIAHPTLVSVVDTSANAGRPESGPVISGKPGLMMPDISGNGYWMLPTMSFKSPSAKDPASFQVNPAGRDASGRAVYTATLRLSITQRIDPATRRAAQRKMEAASKRLNIKKIDLIPREAELLLNFNVNNSVKSMRINGQIDIPAQQAVFQLSGDAVAIAYNAITSNEPGGATLEIRSSYTAYEHVYVKNVTVEKEDTSKPTRTDLTFDMMKRARIKTLQPAELSQRRAKDIVNLKSAITQKRLQPLIAQPQQQQQSVKAGAAIDGGKLVVAQRMSVARRKPVTQKRKMVTRHRSTYALDPVKHRRHFVVIDPNTQAETIFGDNPPWSSAASTLPNMQFQRLGRHLVSLPDTVWNKTDIYESTIEPGRYILVPDRYVIAREPSTGKALIAASTLTDPENPSENQVVFDLGFSPDLDPADMLLIKVALTKRMGDLAPVGHTPMPFYVELPTELGQVLNLNWPNTLAGASSPVADGKILLVSLLANSLTSAKAIFEALVSQTNRLSGSFDFQLEDGIQKSISLIANLRQSEGDVFDISETLTQTDLSLVLSEMCGLTHDLEGVVLWSENGELEERAFNPAALMNADYDNTLRAGLFRPLKEWALRIQTHYPDEITIDPTRYDIGTAMVIVMLSTMLTPEQVVPSDPDNVPVRQIVFEAEAASHPLTAYTMAIEQHESGAQMFAPIVLDWDLPLNLYLQSEQRVLNCRARISFTDGSEVTTAWESHHFGTNPEYTLRSTHILTAKEGANS